MRTRITLRIARKELALLFSSPIAYLFLAAFLAATLFVFFWGEAFFARNISDVRPMFEWLPVLLIFLAAALTMRMWSDERRTGTLELVVTVPATSTEFVIGKFLACWILLVVALALTASLPVTVALLGDLDWGPVFAGYLAVALLGAAYLSIGLFVSAKTENQIVALILAVFGCGAFYLIGSPLLTELVSNRVADLLRAVGAGSRFESITRGLLDLRDLYFYISVLAAFLALNVHALNAHGWAADGSRRHHAARRLVVALVVANVLVANLWLAAVGFMRWDVTEGNQYSISDATRGYLRQLREPLLIRGYFSAKTHPLLAPLGPQLRNLLTEYEIAGGGRLRLELIDPADNPELEDEANSKYGIRPVPFQIADRYQASLVNSYFDVLVQYGDEYEVLGFRDLIEVKARNEIDLDVQLRNPEYHVSRAIKKVLYGFQGGDSVFDAIAKPITFTGYISAFEKLPPALQGLRDQLDGVLGELHEESGGTLTAKFADPEAADSEAARQAVAELGLRPMAASLFDVNTFYFYLTLTDGGTVVQVPIPDTLDRDGLRRGLEDGLKRFATGLLRTVALAAPMGVPPMQQLQRQQQPPGNQFTSLRGVLEADFNVETASLDSGVTPAAADVLLVVDPENLDGKGVFAIDQFLMRGGTVIVAAGSYRATLSPQALYATPVASGLADWLGHHGVSLEQAFVMDPRNTAFPVPVVREVGRFRFQDVQMHDYPYFIDVRRDGLNQDVAFTNALAQLTVAWASPIDVDGEPNQGRKVTTLISSSPASWRSTSTDIMPNPGASGAVAYAPENEPRANTLAVMIEGRFTSMFDASPLLNDEPAGEAAAAGGDQPSEQRTIAEELGTVTTVIDKSPESARLIVIGSAAFLADQTMRTIGSADGTVYTGSLELMANIIDWTVEDQSLLDIRGRGHFNRTLAPMAKDAQRVWEYGNYALVLAGLALTFGISRRRRATKRGAYRAQLGISP